MKLEKIDSGKKPTEWMKFRLSGVSTPFANAIRRAIISEVKTLAIDGVTFIENSSALYDEMLALRIGLVPITTPEDFVPREECDCKGAGCHKCTVMLTLKKDGPGMVYSGEMQSDHKEAKPAFDKIPLVLLGESQKVDVECAAVLGSGKTHAKWQSALCIYEEEEGKKDSFVFYVESFGQKPVAKILEEAAGIIEEKAKALEEKV